MLQTLMGGKVAAQQIEAAASRTSMSPEQLVNVSQAFIVYRLIVEF